MNRERGGAGEKRAGCGKTHPTSREQSRSQNATPSATPGFVPGTALLPPGAIHDSLPDTNPDDVAIPARRARANRRTICNPSPDPQQESFVVSRIV